MIEKESFKQINRVSTFNDFQPYHFQAHNNSNSWCYAQYHETNLLDSTVVKKRLSTYKQQENTSIICINKSIF